MNAKKKNDIKKNDNKHKSSRNFLKENIGFFYVLPWVLGFLIFTIFPIIVSIIIALSDWSIIGDAEFIGLKNFVDIFNDPQFKNSLLVTIRFALVAVPLQILIALFVAISLRHQNKATKFMRVIDYLPSIISGASIGIIFKWILEPKYGLLNSILAIFNISGPDWLYDPNWVLPSYWIMAAWGATAGYLTYLFSCVERYTCRTI